MFSLSHRAAGMDGWEARGRKRDSPLNPSVRAAKMQQQGFPPAPERQSSAAPELEEGKGRLDVWPARKKKKKNQIKRGGGEHQEAIQGASPRSSQGVWCLSPG